ncbi:hypothetical protein WBP07_12910 [Novosphingobium sp. BL-8A]|uniref:hypothetical protein n=1 Tax=Novosphingobium sp. BL-8A TaxID=3127639 RepID=UPI0037570D50
MSDSEYHMVEFRPADGGPMQLVRGRKKTEAEMQADAEAAAEQEESPALLVRIVGDCITPSVKAILLCDQHGNRLPGQVRASLDQTVDRTEITVTFLIDGAEVSFA